jgi:hypothetical protein
MRVRGVALVLLVLALVVSGATASGRSGGSKLGPGQPPRQCAPGEVPPAGCSARRRPAA